MSYPDGHRVCCDLCAMVLIDGNGATIWGRCEYCQTREDQRRKREDAIKADPFHGFREEDEP